MSCFLREQLNHLLVMVVSIPVCLSGLVVICTYLILRCLISYMCGSLFSMVIILSLLISRMLVYIFLLLSIIIIFYDLFGTTHHISRRYYLWGWPLTLGFLQPSLNLSSCFFDITRVSVLLYIWMASLSWFALRWQVRGLSHFCVPYWFALIAF